LASFDGGQHFALHAINLDLLQLHSPFDSLNSVRNEVILLYLQVAILRFLFFLSDLSLSSFIPPLLLLLVTHKLSLVNSTLAVVSFGFEEFVDSLVDTGHLILQFDISPSLHDCVLETYLQMVVTHSLLIGLFLSAMIVDNVV